MVCHALCETFYISWVTKIILDCMLDSYKFRFMTILQRFEATAKNFI